MSELIAWNTADVPHWVNAGNNSSVCCFASMIDSATLDQAKAIARLPFVKPYVAVMPDAHLGKGACIGAVVPTTDAVVPAAVGVDLGCGMIAVKTDVLLGEVQNRAKTVPLEQLRDDVERVIPLSAGNYNQSTTRFPWTKARVEKLEKLAKANQVDFKGIRNAENWANQLGTLGGGNHFIELSYDREGFVWLFLHSGSRGVGNALANRRIKQAQEICTRWKIPLEQADLAYFPHGTPEFNQYIRDVSWAQQFALLNREEMMDRFLYVFDAWLNVTMWCELDRVNCHHNYITWEDDHWVTRKGAVDAHEGVMAVIPGSMGDASYVVRGKGSLTGLNSAPHGAGRLYSRSRAKEKFTEQDLENCMGDIVYRHGKEWVDEIPLCYKPIAQVMYDARELVEPVAELRQIMNVKGT